MRTCGKDDPHLSQSALPNPAYINISQSCISRANSALFRRGYKRRNLISIYHFSISLVIMWNESSQSGFGGGFLDESTAQGGGAKKGSTSNDKSIIPVFIKHITSTTGELQIAGKTVNTLTIVGIVRNIEQDTTKISFTIEDDTGLFFCHTHVQTLL